MVEGTQGSPQALCGCVSVGRLSQQGHGREKGCQQQGMAGQVSNPTKVTQSDVCQVSTPRRAAPSTQPAPTDCSVRGRRAGPGGKSSLHSKSDEGGKELEIPGGPGNGTRFGHLGRLIYFFLSHSSTKLI